MAELTFTLLILLLVPAALLFGKDSRGFDPRDTRGWWPSN